MIRRMPFWKPRKINKFHISPHIKVLSHNDLWDSTFLFRIFLNFPGRKLTNLTKKVVPQNELRDCLLFTI